MANQQTMENHFDQEPQKTTVVHSLEEIARATHPPPAQLPDSGPTHIPATSGDSNSTAALVLGIISLCLPIVSFPTALLGLILGFLGREHGGNKARLGIILNAIALGIDIIGGLTLLIIGIVSHR